MTVLQTIAWTLPFVIIGLGVDDVYIVLMALKKQGGYSLRHWLHAMEEIVVPVTMTSLVNAAVSIMQWSIAVILLSFLTLFFSPDVCNLEYFGHPGCVSYQSSCSVLRYCSLS